MKRNTKIKYGPSREAIKRRYVEGEALLSIAKDYGISPVTVRSIAVQEGAKVRRVGRPVKA